MSVLEVVQTCPTQRKSLLSALGEVDLVDTRLITFDLNNGDLDTIYGLDNKDEI
jgi:hypothetical protein